MNLKASKKIALAITGSGEEEEAPALEKRAPSQKEKGRALRRQAISLISPNPKAKGKTTSSYKTKSQPKISLLKGDTKKENTGLQSLTESKRVKVNPS